MQQTYLELKLSWGLFRKDPDALSASERQRLLAVASKQQLIEQRILASSEASYVLVPRATVDARLAEIRQRYESQQALVQALERSGLDEAQLATAVGRDLLVEALLEKLASAVEPVSAVDAELYYHLHPKAFDRPEARRLRHILITFDNRQEKAQAAMQLRTLRTALARQAAGEFGAAALRHSQCPSAMEGGQLGIVRRRQLYPQLETVAFMLAEREISAPVESPIGLHIVRCDEVLPTGIPPFSQIREKVIDRLTEERRAQAQKDWLRALLAGGHVSPAAEREQPGGC